MRHARSISLAMLVCVVVSLLAACSRPPKTPHVTGPDAQVPGATAAIGDGEAVLPQATAPFTAEITGDAICVAGEKPNIKVSISNNTDEAVYMVGSLDGSDVKWRYPYAWFTVKRNGMPLLGGIARCGNMNVLRQQDFVLVPSGDSFDPYQRLDSGGFFPADQIHERYFSRAGTYTIQFFYVSNSSDAVKWAGDEGERLVADAKIVSMLKRVPTISLASNVFTLTVVDPADSQVAVENKSLVSADGQ